jgi:N utilization substance protein A
MVVSELRGEKIDIIPWNPEPARFVAKALSPARVREVFVDDDTREATVIVPDDQLALAIGKEGLNARLAARLTGWKVDIQSDTEFAQAEAKAAFGGGDDEELYGRCAAVLSNGKRCPNAALPGSKYCGVPAHQALAQQEATLPAETPATAPEATQEEVAALEATGTVEEIADQGVVETPADPVDDRNLPGYADGGDPRDPEASLDGAEPTEEGATLERVAADAPAEPSGEVEDDTAA